jgi:hypothetical protein
VITRKLLEGEKKGAEKNCVEKCKKKQMEGDNTYRKLVILVET